MRKFLVLIILMLFASMASAQVSGTGPPFMNPNGDVDLRGGNIVSFRADSTSVTGGLLETLTAACTKTTANPTGTGGTVILPIGTLTIDLTGQSQAQLAVPEISFTGLEGCALEGSGNRESTIYISYFLNDASGGTGVVFNFMNLLNSVDFRMENLTVILDNTCITDTVDGVSPVESCYHGAASAFTFEGGSGLDIIDNDHFWPVTSSDEEGSIVQVKRSITIGAADLANPVTNVTITGNNFTYGDSAILVYDAVGIVIDKNFFSATFDTGEWDHVGRRPSAENKWTDHGNFGIYLAGGVIGAVVRDNYVDLDFGDTFPWPTESTRSAYNFVVLGVADNSPSTGQLIGALIDGNTASLNVASRDVAVVYHRNCMGCTISNNKIITVGDVELEGPQLIRMPELDTASHRANRDNLWIGNHAENIGYENTILTTKGRCAFQIDVDDAGLTYTELSRKMNTFINNTSKHSDGIESFCDSSATPNVMQARTRNYFRGVNGNTWTSNSDTVGLDNAMGLVSEFPVQVVPSGTTRIAEPMMSGGIVKVDIDATICIQLPYPAREGQRFTLNRLSTGGSSVTTICPAVQNEGTGANQSVFNGIGANGCIQTAFDTRYVEFIMQDVNPTTGVGEYYPNNIAGSFAAVASPQDSCP